MPVKLSAKIRDGKPNASGVGPRHTRQSETGGPLASDNQHDNFQSSPT
jgi:hypothetical protein